MTVRTMLPVTSYTQYITMSAAAWTTQLRAAVSSARGDVTNMRVLFVLFVLFVMAVLSRGHEEMDRRSVENREDALEGPYPPPIALTLQRVRGSTAEHPQDQDIGYHDDIEEDTDDEDASDDEASDEDNWGPIGMISPTA